MTPAALPVPETEFVTYRSEASSSASSSPPDLRIVHFNDVYHLDSSSAEPVGGVARFVTTVNEYRHGEAFKGQPELITLFSGDAFNPSLESSVTKGSHMVPMLNKIGTDCAAVGNHDLDFGVAQFRHLTGKCNFPWLLANVLDPALGENVPLGNAKRTHMITSSNGIKIGLIGLGEREWLGTINTLPPNLIYRSAAETARELIPQLRHEGAELIVALTHMREPNDNKLAANLGGGMIDIILGGHDHYYSHSLINSTHVLRSGSDFKQLSYIEVHRRQQRRSATDPDPSNSASSNWDFNIWQRDIVSSIPEDRDTVALSDRLTASLKKSLDKPVGWTAAPLDARFTTVRLRESNIGNFVCDIMRHHYGTDCAIMASGTIRGDQIYSPGPVRVKDITNCFPFEDPVVVLRVTGADIWSALENSVSLYPALEGRFPQVSNIKFAFDPDEPVGSRVRAVQLGEEPIQMDKMYTVTTRGYMGRGKDGYDSLLVKSEGGWAEEIVSEENGILISMLLRQYFMALRVLDQWKQWSPSLDRHWDRVKDGVHKSHPPMLATPSPTERTRRTAYFDPHPAAYTGRKARTPGPGGLPWASLMPGDIRERRASFAPLDEHVDHDEANENGQKRPVNGDEEEGETGTEEDREEEEVVEAKLRIIRRVFKKWSRLAGVHGRACDALHEGDFTCEWTQAIAPRVEGRIVNLREVRQG